MNFLSVSYNFLFSKKIAIVNAMIPEFHSDIFLKKKDIFFRKEKLNYIILLYIVKLNLMNL